jgi:hypothetical protein
MNVLPNSYEYSSFCLFADIDENTFRRYEKEVGYEDFWLSQKQSKQLSKHNNLKEQQSFQCYYSENIVLTDNTLLQKGEKTTPSVK